MSDLGKLYQRAILEHHQAPRHAGRLAQPTHSADGHNPLCGDRVSVTLAIGGGRLLDVRCDVKGCAICRASGSMMAEAIMGRDVKEVQALSVRFLAAVAREPSALAGTPGAEKTALGTTALGTTALGTTAREEPALAPAQPTAEELEWGELAGLLEARRFPNRRRCASLSWEILQRALSG
jgi:SUF system NifU family Fe-S assembly protein